MRLREIRGTQEPIPLNASIIFDPGSGDIRRDNVIMARLSNLQAQAFEHLLRRPDMVVYHDELERLVYPGQNHDSFIHLEDIARLQKVVHRVRRTLEAIDLDLATRVETIPGRGYRWRVAITDESER